MMTTKRITYSRDKGFILDNMDEIDSYVKEKITYFKDFSNYIDPDSNLHLFGELLDIIEYDLKTAEIDFSPISKLVGVERLKEKRQQIIYLYNIVFILGTIYYNVFDYRDNKLKGYDSGQLEINCTADLFFEGYATFLDSKRHQSSSYGSTLIFMTMLERDMRSQIKTLYISEYLTTLERDIHYKKVKLTRKDHDLYLYLRYHYKLDSKNKSVRNYDTYSATTELCYTLLKKYKVVDPNNLFFQKIFNYNNNYLTLNQMIRSREFRTKVDKRFWKIVNLMFNPKYLNLRNNLTHGNTGYMNYYHVGVTSLLYKLYLMVNDGSFLK
ncbi:hypothetical protein [Haloplasma contractile]|uniref:Uncharacterized protein n=1 Tax=Haloplasma contractile SSD-17B TaxID=1033810 RepID=F7PW82_9MOLU|nr:hypothetical protein [Haloplasma contractile]ERJ11260.1 hypothetical protein HLPCO_002700 [Haloplasma contractile SSD-17B]